MSNPQVTVLLPVFNAAEYLKDAVDSILNQTFKDFELLVIEDGSTDDSLSILKSYNDPRIKIIEHTQNEGLIKTLNEGLRIATGKYIVRMDADDVSLPDRLAHQVKFMNAHPDVSVVGTYFKDIYGKVKVAKTPVSHEALKSQLFFSCALAHPTVIIRKSDFEKHQFFYDADFPHAEDYELWVRVSRKLKIANLPKVLLKYRFHQQQVSSKHNNTQRNSMHRCHQRQLMEMGMSPSENELETHFAIANLLFRTEKKFVDNAEEWLLKIIDANKKANVFSQSHFKRMIGGYWYNICSTLQEKGLDLRDQFMQSAITKSGAVSKTLQLKFRMKYQLGFIKTVQKGR